EDLVGSYQYGLLQSPFLWVNEGWPQSKAMGRHPADQFRALVSGDPIVCNRKYQSPVKVTNPVRIIFTANNAEVVRMLTGNRNLSPEDREALAIRLLHFKTGKRAAEWLRGKGGMRFTGEKGRRWVAAQGDNKSDYIVARHFLWLYANRGGVRGSRLLVEGNYNDDLIWEMRTQSGSAPLVVESLIQMIESARNYEGLVKTDDGRVYVLASEVLKHFRNTTMQRSSGERLNAQQIESVLKGLSVRIPDKPVELKERPQVGFARWYELDVECLLSSARRGGWVSPKLEKLVSARQVAREIEEKARQHALRTVASNGRVDASNKAETESRYATRVRDGLS